MIYSIMRRDEVLIRRIMSASRGGDNPDSIAHALAATHRIPMPELATLIGWYKARAQEIVEVPDPEKLGGDKVGLPPEWLVQEEKKKTAARWRKQRQRSAKKPTTGVKSAKRMPKAQGIGCH